MCRILIALIFGTVRCTFDFGGFHVALLITASTTYPLPLYLDSTSIITSQNALFRTSNVSFAEVTSVARFYYNSCFLAVRKRKWCEICVRNFLIWETQIEAKSDQRHHCLVSGFKILGKIRVDIAHWLPCVSCFAILPIVFLIPFNIVFHCNRILG